VHVRQLVTFASDPRDDTLGGAARSPGSDSYVSVGRPTSLRHRVEEGRGRVEIQLGAGLRHSSNGTGRLVLSAKSEPRRWLGTEGNSASPWYAAAVACDFER